MKFVVILEPEEDGGYSVHVPALPGCHSQGDTKPEALHNVKEAIELYLEVLAEERQTVPKETSEVIARAVQEYLEDRAAFGLPLVLELAEVEIGAGVPA